MRALILAAGLGSRIPEISKKKPKCLIKIKNETILGRQIRIFKKKNIKTIGIVKGYKKNLINFKNVKYFVNKNYKKNDQLDSLITAKKFLISDTIVSFSDIIYDEKILNPILKDSSPISIAIDYKWKKKYLNRFDHPFSQADKVQIKNNKIVKIGKDLPLKKTNAEFLGIMKISKDFIKFFFKEYELIKKNKQSMQIHNFIQHLINKKIKVSYCKVSGKYMEIDTFNDYMIAKDIFK